MPGVATSEIGACGSAGVTMAGHAGELHIFETRVTSNHLTKTPTRPLRLIASCHRSLRPQLRPHFGHRASSPAVTRASRPAAECGDGYG
jgi:hypothetical protein